jgi:hypothetical protein
MKKEFFIVLLSSLFFLFIMVTGCQDSGRFAVAGKAGTLGLGGELTAKVVPSVNARVGINQLDLDFDGEKLEDVEYDLGVELSSFSVLADWHIFEGSFRLSGGVISMDNSIEMDARPLENVEIGDIEYTPTQIGTLTGSIDIDNMAPYVGIGWGNPFTSNSRLGLTCDFGVAFTNSPEVSLLSSGGTYSSDSTFLAELEKERRELEDDMDSIKFYPVISLGLFYRF